MLHPNSVQSRLLAQHLQTSGGESSDSANHCTSTFTEQTKNFPTCSKVACGSLDLYHISHLEFRETIEQQHTVHDYHVLHTSSISPPYLHFFSDFPLEILSSKQRLARKSAFSGRFCTICMCRCKTAGNSKPRAWW